MFDRLVCLPLAQMNTVPGTRPQAVTTPAPAPEAPAVAPSSNQAAQTAIATQPGAAAGSQPSDGKASSGGFLGSLGGLLPIVLMLVVLYFVLIRGQRKEERRRKDLISDLKKGDRVMTIGGLVARVVSIDGDEVVLKIDESANVKATYRKSAIQEVLVADEKK